MLHSHAKRTAGYRAASSNRETQTLIILVSSEEQGIEDELPWTLVCDEHGQISQFETQSEARSFMSAPLDWCEICIKTHANIQDKNTIPSK